jgi:hypothetical protein
MEPQYVFVVGLPRTGSKLVESILFNAPGITYRSSGETFFAGRFLNAGVRQQLRRFGDLGQEANVRRLVAYLYSGQLAGGYWRKLKNGGWGIEREALLNALLATDRTPRAIYASLLQLNSTLTEGTWLGDKTPSHLYHVPTLLEWFPRAKIIHTFRDPRAVLASELLKRIERRPAHYLPFPPGHSLYAVSIVMHITVCWLAAVRLHRRYLQRYPANYTLVQFEPLVCNPEPTIRSLCARLGLAFDQAMLNPRHAGSSYGRHGATGFDPEAVERWQTVLPAWMQTWMEIWTGAAWRAFNGR